MQLFSACALLAALVASPVNVSGSPAGSSTSTASPAGKEPTRSHSEASPFGIMIGTTTCRMAALILGATLPVTPNADKPDKEVVVTATNPTRFYPRATDVEATCEEVDGPVHTLNLGVQDKADNAGARDAYSVLATKYRRVEGGPIPNNGPGYARFVAVDAAIEIRAWGDRQDFLVVYTESRLFERLRKFQEQRRNRL